jgi:hypothetical protein
MPQRVADLLPPHCRQRAHDRLPASAHRGEFGIDTSAGDRAVDHNSVDVPIVTEDDDDEITSQEGDDLTVKASFDEEDIVSYIV